MKQTKQTNCIEVIDHLIQLTKDNHRATESFNNTLIDYFNLVKQGIYQGKNINEINKEING